jgi:hypothetical protein
MANSDLRLGSCYQHRTARGHQLFADRTIQLQQSNCGISYLSIVADELDTRFTLDLDLLRLRGTTEPSQGVFGSIC